MSFRRMLGTSLLLLVGYALLKSWLLEHVPYERAVALGGLYHWSSLVLLAACWSFWLVKQKESKGSIWGDVQQLLRPTLFHALLASLSVWVWNHAWAEETTQLRKSIRMAQINANTESDKAYASFLDAQDNLQPELMPDRQTYREQATAQVDWMLSGGVTLVLSLLVYVLAAFVLSVVSSVVVHQIWGITTFR